MDQAFAHTLAPILLLLATGIVALLVSRALGMSPIVGYLALGAALRASDFPLTSDDETVGLLAELGVVFLLFDLGLHFSLRTVRAEAASIFGLGPVQMLLATAALSGLATAYGMPPGTAVFMGATLALSSTAAVAPLIVERHQQSCPVGLTAIAILIFQDVAAIFLLIVANAAAGGGNVLLAVAAALAKAALGLVLALWVGRAVVGPLFALVARLGREEAFSAMALLVALTAGWAAARSGLSLTLGAFLGGMTLAETPYQAVIRSEIKPFRGLFLGFFFVSVGLSLDSGAIGSHWLAIVAVCALLLAAKTATNALSSLAFRWSVPGSLQLGFLLAQGSEFVFVVLGTQATGALVGKTEVSIVAAAVVLSLGATPVVASAGRALAGRLRARRKPSRDPELERREEAAPVLIVGMGRVGRTIADGLSELRIGYVAVERDQARLREAIADGYAAMYGDMSDSRIWPSVVAERRVSVLTAPSYEISQGLTAMAAQLFPDLTRFAAVADEAEAERFRALGLRAVVERGIPRGLDTAVAVLDALDADRAAVAAWMRREQERALGGAETLFVAA